MPKIIAAARKYPRKSAGTPTNGRVKAKVHKPKITGGPAGLKKQRPDPTPMKKKHRTVRSQKAKAMMAGKVKGPVKYKKL